MSANPMRLAAILPTYNEGENLRQAINRLGQQSRRLDELIVVDDGSTDRESAQLANYFSDPHLRFVPGHRYWPTKFIRLPKNLGVSYALAEGLSHVKSECVWMCSVSDTYHPDFVAKAMSLMDEGATVAAGQGQLGHWMIGRIPDGSPEVMKREGHLVCSHASVAKTAWVRAIFDPTLKWHCDFAVYQDLAERFGVRTIQETMAWIDAKPGYCARGVRSSEHHGIVARIAQTALSTPVLGHLGWPVLSATKQRHRAWPFWRNLLRRELGRMIRRILP